MRLEIFEEATKAPTTQFRLAKKDDNVVLCVVDYDGTLIWEVLTLYPGGKFSRCKNIDRDNAAGLQVDSDGRIKEQE